MEPEKTLAAHVAEAANDAANAVVETYVANADVAYVTNDAGADFVAKAVAATAVAVAKEVAKAVAKATASALE